MCVVEVLPDGHLVAARDCPAGATYTLSEASAALPVLADYSQLWVGVVGSIVFLFLVARIVGTVVRSFR